MLRKIFGWTGVITFGFMSIVMALCIIAGIWTGVSAPTKDWVEIIVTGLVSILGTWFSYGEATK